MITKTSPTSSDRSLNVVLREQIRAEPHVQRASAHVQLQERVVRMWVSGRLLLLPEHALCAGLSDLRLATGARASLEDYGRGVALVLGALASPDGGTVLDWLQDRYPEMRAIPSSGQSKLPE